MQKIQEFPAQTETKRGGLINQFRLYQIITGLFGVFILFAAFGELTRNEIVLKSMATLQMPVYLLTILGIWKILGVAALWLPVSPVVRQWAYAGFFFNLSGAVISLILSRAPFIDDWIFAPLALALWAASYLLYARTR
jgi:hypothetical protein